MAQVGFWGCLNIYACDDACACDGTPQNGSLCFHRSRKPGSPGTFVSGKTCYCHEKFSATKIDLFAIDWILFAAHNILDYNSESELLVRFSQQPTKPVFSTKPTSAINPSLYQAKLVWYSVYFCIILWYHISSQRVLCVPSLVH